MRTGDARKYLEYVLFSLMPRYIRYTVKNENVCIRTVCGTEFEKNPKICFYLKIHNFYAIITKLRVNKQPMGTTF